MPPNATAEETSDENGFTFVQMCDTQLGMGGYEHDVRMFRRAVKQINEMKPDMVFICGDLVTKPDDQSFADFLEIKAGFEVPCHCAPGNHDIQNAPTSATLQNYRNIIGKDYYSFDHKNFTFAIVNTQLWKSPLEGETEKHDQWFRKTLKEAKEKGNPVFVIGHYPLYLNDPEEKDEYFNLPMEKRKEVLDLFEKYNVVAMLGGHAHRLIINDYKGVQLVNGETTSKNFDKRPMGFRVWNVTSPSSIEHEFVKIDNEN